MSYIDVAGKSGYFGEFRKQQAVIRMHNTVIEYLNNAFYNQEEVKKLRPDIEQLLYEGKITSYKAAIKLLDKYFGR